MNIEANRDKSPGAHIWQSRLMGAEAQRLLARPEFSGEILAVFSSAVYLMSRGDEILWLAPEGSPLHRRCILTPFSPQTLGRGQNFSIYGPHLQIGEGTIISLDQTATWEEPSIGTGRGVPKSMVEAVLGRLLKAVKVREDGDGFGQVLPLLSAIAEERDLPSFRLNPLVGHALSTILGLAEACLDRDIRRVVLLGRDLVGLGQGLTPSGDDFLGGLLFAARSLETAYPKVFSWEEQPVTDLIEWAKTQTNPISHAFLRDLALGHGPEPLHEVMVELLRGKDMSRVMAGLMHLVGIGYTSGWDLLAGMMTGMLLVKKQGAESREKERCA